MKATQGMDGRHPKNSGSEWMDRNNCGWGAMERHGGSLCSRLEKRSAKEKEEEEVKTSQKFLWVEERMREAIYEMHGRHL